MPQNVQARNALEEEKQIRLGLLQINPEHGEKQRNMERVRSLARRCSVESRHVDLLLMPELALIGYMFTSRAAIEPLADCAHGGETRAFCAQLCCEFNLGAITCGFARKTESGGIANSLLLTDRSGCLIALYDKAQLYHADKVWGAEEGARFCTVTLPFAPTVKATLAICMDINPYNFENPWDEFELANHAKQHGASLVLMSSAWCSAHPEDDEIVRNMVPDQSKTMEYWASRLEPLFGSKAIFAVADRVGRESGVNFCGSSCLMQLASNPKLLGALGISEEGILVKQLPI
jgi:protein N-terminal amidase